MNNLHTLFLQAQPQGNSMVSTFIMLGAMGIVFYFFMYRPQQKRAKEQKDFREALKVGMQVVTLGGAYGKVKSITDEDIVLEVDNGVDIKFKKSAISMEDSRKLNS